MTTLKTLPAIAYNFKVAFRGELEWVLKDKDRIPRMYHDEIDDLNRLTSGVVDTERPAARMFIELEKRINALTNAMAIGKNPKMKVPQAINAAKLVGITAKDANKQRIEGVEHLGFCITLYQTARDDLDAAGITDLKRYL